VRVTIKGGKKSNQSNQSAEQPIINVTNAIAFDDYVNQDDDETLQSSPPSSCKTQQDDDNNDDNVAGH
jgi:hypothetical protein